MSILLLLRSSGGTPTTQGWRCRFGFWLPGAFGMVPGAPTFQVVWARQANVLIGGGIHA